MKVCSLCEERKPLADFYYNVARQEHQSRCKDCTNATATKPENRLRARLRRYGQTVEQHDRMLNAQGGYVDAA